MCNRCLSRILERPVAAAPHSIASLARAKWITTAFAISYTAARLIEFGVVGMGLSKFVVGVDWPGCGAP